MQSYQREFIEFALASGVLRFGDFTLKSGRNSPYFFNSGLFNSGTRLARLGRFCTEAVERSGIDFDMLYGAAYKGIPLVVATAMGFAEQHARDVPWCFNRKEAKDHGEQGQLVGAPLDGRILMVDDVISAGTSIRESIAIIRRAGANPAGIIVALDRQERGRGETTAMQEVGENHAIETLAIIRLADLMDYLGTDPGKRNELERMRSYLAEYGAPRCGLKLPQ